MLNLIPPDTTVHALPLGAVHAPGPWRLCAHLRNNDECKCGYRGGIWDASGEFQICEMGGSPEHDGTKMVAEFDRPTTQANARLIAAAPDLLEALVEVVNSWEQGDVFAGHAAIGTAKAALAKARGETVT
jgi:hypothetical protein